MRASSMRWMVALAAVTLVVPAGTGCKSFSSWKMPGTDWMSWSKPKPTATSTAKTAPVPPPAHSFAPAPTATAAVPGTQPPYGAVKPNYAAAATSPAAGYQPYSATAYPTTTYPTQPATATQPSGYETGRYTTSGTGLAQPAANVQRGFYAENYQAAPGNTAPQAYAPPAAATAGAWNNNAYTSPAPAAAPTNDYRTADRASAYGAPPSYPSNTAPAPAWNNGGAAAPPAGGSYAPPAGAYPTNDAGSTYRAPEQQAPSAYTPPPAATSNWNAPAAAEMSPSTGGYRPGSVGRYEPATAGNTANTAAAPAGGGYPAYTPPPSVANGGAYGDSVIR